MLIIARSMGELSFGSLMEIYVEGNRENGGELYPQEPEARQIALAEQDFYDFLRNDFFSREESRYMILEEEGTYLSALRLERYQDGLLMEALETVPWARNRGFAARLIRLVQELLTKEGSGPVYSHVSNFNAPSLAVHSKCGFRKILDYAAYQDGSINRRSQTLRWTPDFLLEKKQNAT